MDRTKKKRKREFLTLEEVELILSYRQADARRKELVMDVARTAAEYCETLPKEKRGNQSSAKVVDLSTWREVNISSKPH